MSEININRQRLTLRIGRGTLAVSTIAEDEGLQHVVYEPYVVKSGISMAANLREAFKNCDLLLQTPPRVRVLFDSDVLIVPVEMFNENDAATMMHHAFPNTEQDAVYYNVVPDLNCVALFAMNRDLRLVIDDHFRDVQLIAASTPVWRHLHHRSFTGTARKLYGYFHEKQLSVFSFQQNRFKFCNSFEAARSHDALYFLLYAWQQLQLQSEHDELHLVGDIPEQEWFLGQLRRFLQKVYIVNPQADFTDHPAAKVKGMPYDLMTLYAKGR